jgi:prepilin-type N-terminal cleavage/methylation domain-containing protein
VKKGFTIVEIIIALIVASVVAGVTMNITKQKIENTTGYYYYSAYALLKAAADEIIADTNPLTGDICTQIQNKLNVISNNCSANPKTITLRSGVIMTIPNSNATIGVLNNVNGWTINIDIDGTRGKGANGVANWVDIFTFYLTTDGKVIPAYTTGKGADSDKHLAVSIKYDTFPSGVRQTNWLRRSVSFRQAACESGYAAGTYCTTAPAFSKHADCIDTTADCRIVPIKPSPIGEL